MDTINTEQSQMGLEERVNLAGEYFQRGFGCCQSVLAAFADLFGLSEEQALRIGCGFGGGVGKMRMMCGAVSGMVVLAGLESGQTESGDKEQKAECYRIVQELLAEFKEKNGSIICAELLGMKQAPGFGDHTPSERTTEYYAKRPCRAKVESAAGIFVDFLKKQEKKV